MSSDTLDAVRARLRELAADKKKLQRQRNERQASDRGKTSRAKFGQAVAAEILRATSDEATAAEFTKEHWGKRCKHAVPLPATPAAAGTAHAPPLDPTLSAGDAGSNMQTKAGEAAARWLRERSLAAWVGGHNFGKGLAPSNANVWASRSRLQEGAPNASSSGDAAGPKPRTVRTRNQWLSRWARRWGLQRGALQSGEILSPEELRTKAWM